MAVIRINKDDITEIVSKCVWAIINESRHALDVGVERLITDIVNMTIGNRKYSNLRITPKRLEQYLPKKYFEKMFGIGYSLEDIDPLYIKFVDTLDSNEEGYYDYWRNIIYLKKHIDDLSYLDEKSIESLKRQTEVTLSHEFSHFIDNNAQNRLTHQPEWSDDEKKSIPPIVFDFIYYFNPTEIQARLNQYNTVLRLYPSVRQSVDDGESTLSLNKMKSLLQLLGSLQYDNGGELTKIITYLSYLTKFIDMQRKRYIKNDNSHNALEYVSHLKKTIPIANVELVDNKEFNNVRNSLYHTYRRRYIKMSEKANKIQKDWLNCNQS